MEQSLGFIKRCRRAVRILRHESPDLTRFKLALAILDNVRNILLQLSYVALVAEAGGRHPKYQFTRELYSGLLSAHTEEHLQFLLNPDADWAVSLYRYETLLKEIEQKLVGIRSSLFRLTRRLGPEVELFKWRECDHFLQNLAAVQLGLHELRQRPEIARTPKIVAVGLAYGGTELPAIARAVAVARRFGVEMALAMISIYGNRKVGRQIRAGKYDYVAQMLSMKKPLCLMEPNSTLQDKAVVVMDDNCTTCTTLQHARDFVLKQGGDVVGAVIVRFPGVNRRVQMQMRGHGFPDPEVLFSFVRGLIAPSPYTRLHFPAPGRDPYLDQTKIFDKAKDRIKRYLRKNESYPGGAH
jgi:hypothetical protein